MIFDRLAPHYYWMEALAAGKLMQRARAAFLDELNGQQRILSVGEGHGRFAEAVVTRFPNAKNTFVEESAKLLVRANERLGPPAANVRCHCGDVRAWEPDDAFDAIVTCFFLDGLPPTRLPPPWRDSRTAPFGLSWTSHCQRTVPRWRAQAVHGQMYSLFSPRRSPARAPPHTPR